MEAAKLSSFLLEHSGMLILIAAGLTIIVIAVVVFLAVSESRRLKLASESPPKDLLHDLTNSVKSLEKSLNDLKKQFISKDQHFSGQITALHKQSRDMRDDLDNLKEKIDHQENMKRMEISGIYRAQNDVKEEAKHEKEPLKEESEKTGFWGSCKKAARYVSPWKLFRGPKDKKNSLVSL